MEGRIVLIVFPQDKQQKIRPALVLKEFPKYGDILVCGISSQLHQFIEGFDVLIDENHPDFSASGLKFPGVFRLSMLTMLPGAVAMGSIGQLSDDTHNLLLKTLSDYLVYKNN